MKKVLSTVLAASLMLATVSAPALAGDRGRHDGWNGHGRGNGHYDGRNYGHRGGHYRGGHGDAVAAGILGLTFGALAASSARRDRGYGYSDGYYYGRPPRTCISREQHWDPYERAYITIDRPYAC